MSGGVYLTRLLDQVAAVQEHSDPDAPQVLRVTEDVPSGQAEIRRVRFSEHEARVEAWIHPDTWARLLTARDADGEYSVGVRTGGGMDALFGIPVVHGELPAPHQETKT